MQSKKQEHDSQNRLFQFRLENIIDTDHPLVRLTEKIDWLSFEKKLEEIYILHPRQGAPCSADAVDG